MAHFHTAETRGDIVDWDPKPTLLMLLVLIVANHLAEQGGILGAQLLRHGGCRRGGGLVVQDGTGRVDLCVVGRRAVGNFLR